jgi:DNA-binding transcriptional regulator YiaG
MASRKSSLDDTLKRLVQETKDYAAGKTRLKTTLLSPTGERSVFYESLPEAKARRARRDQFKAIRSMLGLTQPKMAQALRVSVNTLKGWEAGKPIPEVAMTLAEVLNDFPAVRKKLTALVSKALPPIQ